VADNGFDEDESINDNNINEFMDNLSQISKKLIDNIQIFNDTSSEETILTLINVFDFQVIEKMLNLYICKSFV
jgi:hypothetical protein